MTESEKMVFCTLFDSNYLDKGLALYASMRKHIKVFRLYIFAFDDKAFEVLSEMHLKNVVVLSVNDIMDHTLQRIKGERTRGEFCWTCTSVIIEYVLQTYNEKMCTYVDADIFFFANPKDIIQEIIDDQCAVGLVEHRFERNALYGKEIFRNGKYCIQFNTFMNNNEGRKVLKDWKEQCLEWCYGRREDGRFGDQKYPDRWKMRYSCVHVSTCLGAGVAPWNLHVYTNIRQKDGKVFMNFKDRPFPVLFYHYEGMQYLDAHRIYLNLWKYSEIGTKRKVNVLYGTYFIYIERIRKILKDSYGITFDHMIADQRQYLGGKHSVINFCKEQGLINGIREWLGYCKNNVFTIHT